MSRSPQVIAEEPHRERLTQGGIGEDRPPLATLPREIIQPVTWRRVVLLVAIVLTVLVIANWAANAYLLRYTPNGGYWLIREKWRMVERLNEPTDWVILGDSSCLHGLDPEVWDAIMGGRSLNLCTIGNMIALNDVWMLHRLVERGLAPRAVLVIHVHNVWQRNPNPRVLGQLPSRSTWSEGNPRVRLGPTGLLKEFLSRHVPLISQNGALRSVLTKPDYWFEPRFGFSEQGFMAAVGADPMEVTRDARNHLQAVQSKPFSISESNAEALAELRRISHQHGIEVFLTSSPMFEGLLADERFSVEIDNMHTHLSKWSDSGARLHYLPDIVTFPKTDMRNADHLVAEAARAYTRRVAALVSQAMEGGTNLERDRAHPPRVHLRHKGEKT